MPALAFPELADDADDADANSPGFSGAEEVAVIVMVRVRARPSFVKAISIPILRRKVAARRSRPDSARGLSGQVFDLVTRSPTTSARAPRRSEAIPVHTVRTVCVAAWACFAACSAACFAMKARTAVATGSASMTPSTASSRLPE